MGRLITEALATDTRAVIIHTITRNGIASRDGTITHDRRAIPTRSIDVVVDFSSEDGTLTCLDIARNANAALLVGTTGLSVATLNTLRSVSHHVPVLVAPNTSIGIAVLARVLREAARALHGFDASILDIHHTKKKDAPSGTAKRLADALRESGTPLSDNQILSIRAGDVVGEHTIRLCGPGEVLEFTHRATSRTLFAQGAVTAALWLAHREPGWYTMDNALNLA